MSKYRSLDEPCMQCGAAAGEQCIDRRAFVRPGRPLPRISTTHLRGSEDG